MKKYLILFTVLVSQFAFGYTPPTRARGTAVLNVKNFGAYGDGRHNDTAAIQSAINSLPSAGGTVYIPAGKYMVDASKSIRLRSKMLLKLDPLAELRVMTNGLSRYYTIRISNVSDVEVSGGKLIGDRTTHTGTTGEWGYGVSINGGTRVTIRDMKISNMWGDGLGVWPGTLPSNDVVIYNTLSTNNRRQGLSIGGSTNVTVYGSEFSYTNGTAPQYGIDIEPDGTTEAHNIRIQACKIHHNKGGGIQAYKRSYNVLISTNEIAYNSYGIYTVGMTTGTVWNNKLSHNRYHGVALRSGTVDAEVFANQFRNNYTSLRGITNDTNPLVSITGTSTQTRDHLNVSAETSAISIRRNYYAK